MNPQALLNVLTELGIQIVLQGEDLGYRSPKGQLTEQLKHIVRDHKPELVRLLHGDRQDSDDPMTRIVRWHERLKENAERLLKWLEENSEHPSFAERFEEWGAMNERIERHEDILQALRTKGYIPIRCEAMGGETVIFLRDQNVELPTRWKDKVTYTLDELEVIREMGRQELLMLHDMKKNCGEKVPGTSSGSTLSFQNRDRREDIRPMGWNYKSAAGSGFQAQVTGEEVDIIDTWQYTPKKEVVTLERLTIRISEELHEKIRWLSYKQRRSINSLVLEILEKALADVKAPKEEER